MSVFEPPSGVLQVLLCKNPRFLEDLGPVLWCALREVASLYSRARRFGHVRFQRRLLVPGRASLELGSWIQPDDVLSLPEADPEQWWRRNFVPRSRTIDQKQLGESVRAAIGTWARDLPLVVLTDAEITPPADWRYIIWDSCRLGSIVSTAPLDPNYWGASNDEGRRSIIKQRARAASCSAVGGLLGLLRCDRPRCFMFENVDDYAQLDHMSHIGSEHEVAELDGVGFDSEERNPDTEQPPHEVCPSRMAE